MRVSVAPAIANKSVNSCYQSTEILTIRGERWELGSGAGELEVLSALGGWERRGLVHCRLRRGDDIGAVDEAVTVVAEDSELGHSGLEAGGHECLLVDEALPEARSARVARECKVGLETHLASVGAAGQRKRRRNLASVVSCSGEAGALEQHFKEHLGVEGEGGL
jgi:hypothetical protein